MRVLMASHRWWLRILFQEPRIDAAEDAAHDHSGSSYMCGGSACCYAGSFHRDTMKRARPFMPGVVALSKGITSSTFPVFKAFASSGVVAAPSLLVCQS